MNPFLPVDDPDDPRLADYRHTRDRDLASEGGRFVAESELVVRRLLTSPLITHSVLATPTRLATLGSSLARATCPVYVANQAVRLYRHVQPFHDRRNRRLQPGTQPLALVGGGFA